MEFEGVFLLMTKFIVCFFFYQIVMNEKEREHLLPFRGWFLVFVGSRSLCAIFYLFFCVFVLMLYQGLIILLHMFFISNKVLVNRLLK